MVGGAKSEPFQPLRIGMVGGGIGAFIGGVHRIALAMDGQFELVAGAFSSDPQRSLKSGAELGLDPDRIYKDYRQMAETEEALPQGERIQAVAIVTPNDAHFDPAQRFLRAGIPVICDKPLATSLEQAKQLERLVKETTLPLCVTHNYSGYPMVREAREVVASGALGEIRKVYVEYLQGWLSDSLEATGHKQALWRTDPKRSGPCGAMGDIGTHAHHLVEFVSGQKMQALSAVLNTFVSARRLDDDGMVLFKLANGGTGTLSASQVCVGVENGLRIRVFGTAGGLSWHQERPTDLWLLWKDRAPELRRPGNPWLSAKAADCSRLPAGHPEGYLEAFATLYREFAKSIRGVAGWHPGIAEGLRGMQFLDAVVRSHESRAWVEL